MWRHVVLRNGTAVYYTVVITSCFTFWTLSNFSVCVELSYFSRSIRRERQHSWRIFCHHCQIGTSCTDTAPSTTKIRDILCKGTCVSRRIPQCLKSPNQAREDGGEICCRWSQCGLLVHSDDWGIRFLRNIGTCLIRHRLFNGLFSPSDDIAK
jgi:hypothetical protein